MKALLIAEKPSLMNEIKKAYQNMTISDEITFMSFTGHIMSLAKPGEYKEEWAAKEWNKDMLPIIPDKFKCVVSDNNKAKFNELKKEVLSGKYDYLINACDPDREGQAIWQNFIDYLECKLPVKRFWSNDLTEKKIQNTLLNLRDNINEPFLKNLTIASQLRANFDWLVGMNLSVICSLKMGTTCNIGRVKIPTLKLLVDRELEIRNFTSSTTYEVEGIFKEGYSGIYIDEDGPVRFKTLEMAKDFSEILPKTAKVKSIIKKTDKINPQQLYSLDKLQKDCNEIFGYPSDKTKMLAQSLYEKKILSYPRSDNPYISTELAKEFPRLFRTVQEIEELAPYANEIVKNPELLAKVGKNKNYVNDAKMAESGHYAITPTGTKPNLNSLSDDEKNVLTLVCKRFVGIFLPQQQILKTTVITEVGDYLFKTNASKVIEKGFTILYKSKSNDIELPNIKEGDITSLKDTKINEKISKPPKRFTDATLLAAMVNPIKYLKDSKLKDTIKESKGIGTVATRDVLITELVNKEYIKREKKNLVPSEKSIAIIKNLDGRNIVSIDLTGIWENKLAEIESGNLNADEFRNDMVKYVLDEINAIDSMDIKVKIPGNKKKYDVIGVCPKCKGNVLDGKSYYICEHYKKENNSCDFVISKMVMGAKITKSDIINLLNNKPTKEKVLTKKDKTKITKKLIIDSNGKLALEKAAIIGKCPKCGSNIINTKYYKCEKYKNGCDFILGKTFGEAEITIEDVQALLEMKQTPTMKNCKWKSGNISTVFLKLDDDFKIKPIFDNKPRQVITEVGKCPKCGGRVMSSRNFYYCENHPDKCNFTIKKELKGAIISDKDIQKLINNEMTDKILFKWNEKRSSEARLKYTNKLEFVFED